MPVYDLTVAPGYQPEFYANGLLVHNCTWIPNDPKFPSPDRVDALVWAATEVILGGGGAEIVVASPSLAGGNIPRF